jgi:hypothetical protein
MTLDWVTSTIERSQEWLPSFLNSNFITSLVGAGAGAWAGAYAAQKIATRSKLHDDLLSKIRNTNAGVRLAGMICNASLTLKKQHIKPLKEIFDSKKEELIAILAAQKLSQSPTVFEFVADFQNIPPLSIPNETFEALQRIVFERIDASSLPTILVPTLLQAINHYNSSIAYRNRLIEEIRTAGPRNIRTLAHLYFGLPDDNGNTDNRYGSLIYAISSYTDDCLFFSKMIADELGAYGKSLQTEFNKTFRNEAAKVASFAIAKTHLELMPKPADYPGWDRIG